MPSRRSALVFLTLLALLGLAAPVPAQETREFSGMFQAVVQDAVYEEPLYYVAFSGAGESDLLGFFAFENGTYTVDTWTIRLYDGFMTLSTAQGDLWTYFEGDGVFTGRFEGVLYFYGGTGIYENAWGEAFLAAQFFQREFSVGEATFSFVGSITY